MNIDCSDSPDAVHLCHCMVELLNDTLSMKNAGVFCGNYYLKKISILNHYYALQMSHQTFQYHNVQERHRHV